MDNMPISRSLFEICQAMVSAGQPREVLHTILSLSVQTLQADAGSILLYEEKAGRVEMLASFGLPEAVVKRGYLPRPDSVTEQVMRLNRPMVIQGTVSSNPMYPGFSDGQTVRSALCAPLAIKGKPVGTMNLNRCREDAPPYNDQDIERVSILASQAAICIENARLQEDNLRQARMAAIGYTTSGISHCVKNLLTGLRGGVGLLEIAQNAQDWDAAGRGLTVLRHNVDRLSLLILDILDLSKDSKPVQQPTTLSEIFSNVAEVAAFKTERRQQNLTWSVDPLVQSAWLDPHQIFRCLLNLLDNAHDAAGQGGTITLAASKAAPDLAAEAFGEAADNCGYVCLTVADSGPGIPADVLPHLFEPFYTTKHSAGTGLGLAVTHRLVENHRGRIVVHTHPERGTAFHILLPQPPGGAAGEPASFAQMTPDSLFSTAE
jgi:signal transduction histidine kinase